MAQSLARLWTHLIFSPKNDFRFSRIQVSAPTCMRRTTFEEDFRAFLEKYEIEYDERYVWD